MKKNYFLLILFLVSSSFAQAQYILSMQVTPANPTVNNPVTIIAECAFPSGDCYDKTTGFSVNGNHIYANALHCLGLATFICTEPDTFIIPPLTAGTYWFHFNLDAGLSPGPCTPGIVPGAIDSIQFTVTQTTSLPDYQPAAIGIFPNPSNDLITISGAGTMQVQIIETSGRLVMEFPEATDGQQLDLSPLAAGTYVIRVVSDFGVLKNIRLMHLPAVNSRP